MGPIAEIAVFMKRHELMLVTAESCTAGLIAARLADIPGAGALLDCAFVVYSRAAKQNVLQVRAETIDRFGLTSEEVAREMAEGALARSHANLAIANTGITEAVDNETPPGTQCFVWIFRHAVPDGRTKVYSETRRFSGSRNAIRNAASEYALRRIPHLYGLLRADD
jgi:PncC family amidohydrolase